MKRLVLLMLFALAAVWLPVHADDDANDQAAIPPVGTKAAGGPQAAAPAPALPAHSHATTEQELKVEAAAAAVYHEQKTAVQHPPANGFIEHIVDSVLELFDVDTSRNTPTHYVVSALFLILALFLRRVFITLVFGRLRKLAARTKTTLDDRLLPAIEDPSRTLVGLLGIFCALDALKFSDTTRHYINIGATIAFSLACFWFLLRTLDALLDHAQEIARAKNLGVAAFMPWIKKTIFAVFIVFGVLMIAQSLGANVRAFLAGLGIGGLAFALAAQDTLANLFASVVVAIDQPFKIGETVRIGDFLGLVEDIGLRSTRLRALDKSLVVMPNKTVASESVTNLSRFTQRRTEQVIGLTYDTSAEQMDAIVGDFRRIILAEDGIDPSSVLVFFRDYNASSLDIWVVYVATDPDFVKYMQLRQRLNLAFMRAVAVRGLAFAFPTQTVVLDGPVARQLAEKKN
ncbi:MAG TPA: mechanosensitive ion channel family protein [Opitutaceae bacterium]|nr:mechanosensitive ion channel family protein [Opitutaceae bacterium]